MPAIEQAANEAHEPFKSRATYRSLLDYLVVLPPSHLRVWDLSWQYAVYDAFHTRRPSQLSHATCMTPNVLTWILFAGHLSVGGGALLAGHPVGTALNGGFILAMLLALVYFWYDRLVGLVLLPVMLGLWIGSNLLAAHWGNASLHHTLVLAVVLSCLQAYGHAPEPIPPPWSCSDQFVPVGEWLRRAPLHIILGYGVMALVGPVLEYWAAPRLLAVQALMVLGRFGGYRPEFRRLAAVKTKAFYSDIKYAIHDTLPPEVSA